MCLWCFKSLKTCGFLLLFLSRNEWYRKQTHSIENMVVVQSGSNFSALTKKIDQLLHNGYHMSKFRISRFAAATIKTKRNKKNLFVFRFFSQSHNFILLKYEGYFSRYSRKRCSTHSALLKFVIPQLFFHIKT